MALRIFPQLQKRAGENTRLERESCRSRGGLLLFGWRRTSRWLRVSTCSTLHLLLFLRHAFWLLRRPTAPLLASQVSPRRLLALHAVLTTTSRTTSYARHGLRTFVASYLALL